MYVWGDTLATVEQVTAYATARGWSDWAALTLEQKTAAVLNASTFVRVSYRAPQTISAAVDQAVTDAVAEAARLSLTGPLLGGSDAGKAAKRRVQAGSVSVEYADRSTASLRGDRLALVNAMLVAAGARSLSGVDVPLQRA